MKIKLILLFLAASFIILFQFLKSSNVIVKNDLNGNIVPLQYFKDSIIKDHTFPLWNPYINQGIPGIADPLYGIYNPIISLPILLFNYSAAIKIIYFISTFLAMLFMFLLIKEFKIRNNIAIMISLTYASGTYLISKITAGHLEKIVSFAFIPLLIFALIKLIKEKNFTWAGVLGCVISLILFTGDIYNTLYALYTLLAVSIFFLFKDKKISLLIIASSILFFLFSSIKILPMLELQNYITKIKEPFVGNLTFLSILYYLFFPFNKNYDYILLSQKFLSNSFGWWENYAFIGPFSLLGLIFLFTNKIKKIKTEKRLFIFLSILFVLMSMPGADLNPLKFFISHLSILQYFHVPSRILLILSIVILIFFGLYLNKLKNNKYMFIILFANLIITFTFSQYAYLNNQFDNIDKKYEKALDYISKQNTNNYLAVHQSSQGDLPQDAAYNKKVLLLQSNYGLFLKNSLGEKYNFKGNNEYKDLLPGYLISNSKIQTKNYLLEKEFGNIYIYKNFDALPFASIQKKSQQFDLKPNKITLSINSNDSKKLILLESNYPGWKASIDNKEVKLVNGRFLTVQTIRGQHIYEFKYISKTFNNGILISLISFVLFIVYVIWEKRLFANFNYRNIISKKWL